MILAIDPGRHPGYVLLDETQLVERKHFAGRPRLPLILGAWRSFESYCADRTCRSPSIPTIVVIEGQHGKLSDARRNSILTLANEAGWQLRRAVHSLEATPVIVHPQATGKSPPGWRDALRCARVAKEVVQARVSRSLLPSEAPFFSCHSVRRMGDLLDAVGIGWGYWILQPKAWESPP